MTPIEQRQLAEYQAYHREMAASWDAMGEGSPTLAALAALCARTILQRPSPRRPSSTASDSDSEPIAATLSSEAQAILYAAKDRGVIEVRGVKTAFEAPGRLLAVYVERDEHRTIAFRDPQRPESTVRFFEAFCELCRSGLIMHHLHRDFTLSKAGFEIAGVVQQVDVQQHLDEATEFGLHDR